MLYSFSIMGSQLFFHCGFLIITIMELHSISFPSWDLDNHRNGNSWPYELPYWVYKNTIMESYPMSFPLWDLDDHRNGNSWPYEFPYWVYKINLMELYPILFPSWDQAWGEVLWYLYLRTLKYTFLSTCTYT